ncbi:hypothetical protein J3R82DRAFT_3599 [Butyriboletus roseoflavus]|nr:hypothetical protein J3R82DRAFT_3599 [Butyriboletus roseoflavus]
MDVLGVGYGPGTITASFAHLVPHGHVTGIDHVPVDSDVLEKTHQHAAEQGVTHQHHLCARGYLQLRGDPRRRVRCHLLPSGAPARQNPRKGFEKDVEGSQARWTRRRSRVKCRLHGTQRRRRWIKVHVYEGVARVNRT